MGYEQGQHLHQVQPLANIPSPKVLFLPEAPSPFAGSSSLSMISKIWGQLGTSEASLIPFKY